MKFFHCQSAPVLLSNAGLDASFGLGQKTQPVHPKGTTALWLRTHPCARTIRIHPRTTVLRASPPSTSSDQWAS